MSFLTPLGIGLLIFAAFIFRCAVAYVYESVTSGSAYKEPARFAIVAGLAFLIASMSLQIALSII